MPPKTDFYFFDTTLRDGEQSPGCSMTQHEKLQMAHALADLGVDILEAGFAISSDGDFAAIEPYARESSRPGASRPSRAPERGDIERAAAALERAQRLADPCLSRQLRLHLQYKLKISREEALDQAAKSVTLARTLCRRRRVLPRRRDPHRHRFSLQDRRRRCRSRSHDHQYARHRRLHRPQRIRQPSSALIRERVPGADNVIFSSHCHNDLGLAVANCLAAIEAEPARSSAPSTASASAPAMPRSKRSPPRCTFAPTVSGRAQLNSSNSIQSASCLAQVISFAPSPNKAVVGSNAFAHEAGIHQHGVLSNPLTYEIMTPASVGVPGNRMVLGKHSGRHALAHAWLSLVFDLAPADLDIAYRAFTELADRRRRFTTRT